MYCPKCNSENKDSAKFCKKCGTSLTKVVKYENNNNKSDNSKIIIVALIIITIVLAGALVYMYGFGNSHNSDSDSSLSSAVSNSSNSQSVSSNDNDVSSQSSSSQQSSSNMKIISGSFNTGSELEDKTYARIYVGPEYAGESVTVQIFYSRDGSSLNNGNMVPVHVDSSGYIEVSSADAYKYYPDYAKINLYSSSGKLLDTKSVSLSTTSGTQTF